MSKEFEIIAETAFSHEGSIDYLFKQIEEAKKGAADYIKFQILINPKESYTSEELVKKVKNWIIKKNKWIDILERSKNYGLKTIVLPLNVSSAKFCINHNKLIDKYEIHSVCFNDIHLINKLNEVNKDIILGIGGRYPQEIANVMDKFPKNNIILIYGFQSFPTDYNLINLNKIEILKQLFDSEIGFADHTSYDNDYFHNLNEYAYLKGAKYFEKHIVLNKGNKRIDYESAIDSKDFKETRKRLEKLVKVLGKKDIFNLNNKEKKYRNREKELVFSKDLEKGKVLDYEDLFYKISSENSDFEQIEITNLIGRKLSRCVKKNEVLKYHHILEN